MSVTLIFYTGAVLTLSSYPSHAILNQPITLTCTVLHAVGLVDIIVIRKIASVGDGAVLRQYVNNCTVYSIARPSRYTPSCGNGTHSSSSFIKKYALFINKVSASEVTDWYCQLHNQLTYTNYTLKLVGKLWRADE